MTQIIINTDGACSGNPGPGGFGAIINWDGVETVISGGEPRSTNNRMELSAVIEAFHFLATRPESKNIPVTVRSDSTYVTHAFNKGWINSWRRKGFHTRTNGDLWQTLDRLITGRKITWQWVRGHSGDRMNERCDRLAVRMSAKAGREYSSYWCTVDGQAEPATTGVQEGPEPTAPETPAQKPTTPEREKYPAPDTGSPATDALELNRRAATCAELALLRYEAGRTEEAWEAMRTTLEQLKQQEVLLETMR